MSDTVKLENLSPSEKDKNVRFVDELLISGVFEGHISEGYIAMLLGYIHDIRPALREIELPEHAIKLVDEIIEREKK